MHRASAFVELHSSIPLGGIEVIGRRLLRPEVEAVEPGNGQERIGFGIQVINKFMVSGGLCDWEMNPLVPGKFKEGIAR